MSNIVLRRVLKKSSLTVVLLLCGWFVYAGIPDDYNYFNLKAKIVKVYPNPATTVVNFEFTQGQEKNYTLQIFSFTGKKMYEQPILFGKVSTISLGNDYFRGIYYYKINDNTGRIIESGKFQVVK